MYTCFCLLGDNTTHSNSKKQTNQELQNAQGYHQQKTNNRNREDKESEEKQRRNQELRRIQEEEMAQVYPTKYSWANGKSERSSMSRGGSNSSGSDGPKVFDMYSGNLEDSPVGVRASKEKMIQMENELKDVSYATSHIRQKWRKEENRAASLSPVLSRKQKDVMPAGQKQRLSSDEDQTYGRKQRLSGTDDQALQVLEQQLKQLQLEAKLAR